jgi:hypothetical protein
MRVLANMLLLLAVSGCSGNHKETLAEALRQYNEGVRWGRRDWSIEQVPLAQREDFVVRWAQCSDARVTGYDVQSLNFSSDGEQAAAIVAISWYDQRELRLTTSLVRQLWRRTGKHWLIEQQRWVSGVPFPLAQYSAPSSSRTR